MKTLRKFFGHFIATLLVTLPVTTLLVAIPQQQALATPIMVSFSGVLRTALGVPVVGATFSYQEGGNNETSRAFSGAGGAFTVQAAPGTGQLVVDSPASDPNNFRVSGITIDLSSGNVTQDLTLPALSQVTVNVTTALGAPVASASVSQDYRSGAAPLWPSGPNGNVALTNISGHNCSTSTTGSCAYRSFIGATTGDVHIIDPNGPTIHAAIPAITGPAATLNVQLPSLIPFSGILRTALGAPVVGADISLSGNTWLASQGQTGADGTFTVLAATGAYQLTVGSSSFTVTGVPVDLSAGAVIQDLTLPALSRVTVHVTDALGNPIPNVPLRPGPRRGPAALWVHGPNGDANLAGAGICSTGITGSCSYDSFIGADASDVTIDYSVTNGNSTTTIATIVAALPAITGATATLNIQLPDMTASFSGILRNALGAPIAGAGISMTGAAGSASYSPTGADGSFTLLAPPGTYQLTAGLNNLTVTGIPVDLSAGDVVQDMTTPALSRVAVSVTDAAGNALAGASVTQSTRGGTAPLWLGGPTGVANLAGAGTCSTEITGSCSYDSFVGASTSGVNTFIVTNTGSAPSGNITFLATLPAITGPTTILDIQIPHYASATSAGSRAGNITIETPSGTRITNIASSEVVVDTLPPGFIALTGALSYRIRDVAVGGSVNVILNLPSGSNPTAVYSVNADGSYRSLSALATIVVNKITLRLTDGGTSDQDGIANGVIVGPVVPVGGSVVSALSLTSSIPSPLSGQAFVLTANITAQMTPGELVAGGSVTFYDGASSIGTAPVTAGTARLIVRLEVADLHALTAVYSGTPAVIASESPALAMNVRKAPTRANLIGRGILGTRPVTLAGPLSLRVLIRTTSPARGRPTGVVLLREGDVILGSMVLNRWGANGWGLAGFPPVYLTPGYHTLTVDYQGDANRSASSVTRAVTVL